MRVSSISLNFFRGLWNGRVEDVIVSETFKKSGAAHYAKHLSKVSLPSDTLVFLPHAKQCSGAVTNANARVSASGLWRFGLQTTQSPPKSVTFCLGDDVYSVPASVSSGVGSVTGEPTQLTIKTSELQKCCREYTTFRVVDMLRDLTQMLVRHASAITSFDQYAFQDQHVQRCVALLETMQYGLLSLFYGSESFEQPLVTIFARKALREAVSAVHEVLGTYTHSSKKAHPQNTEMIIDYTAFKQAEILSKSLVGCGETDCDCASVVLEDVLSRSPKFSITRFSTSPLKMTAVHINLSPFAQSVESALSDFAFWCAKLNPQVESELQAAGDVAAELLACVASIHRCSSSLEADPEGEGRIQWNLCQTFCNMSFQRQRALMTRVLSSRHNASFSGDSFDDLAKHPSL